MRPCRIILADDHTLVRQGIKKILEENPDLEVIGEAADGQEAVNLLKKLQPDLVILDIQMPRMNGLEAAKMIRERCPAIKILILTMHKEDEYFRQAREIGVQGFVFKQDVDLVLLSAVKAICSGKAFVKPPTGDWINFNTLSSSDLSALIQEIKKQRITAIYASIESK